jgi:hypothetical protein
MRLGYMYKREGSAAPPNPTPVRTCRQNHMTGLFASSSSSSSSYVIHTLSPFGACTINMGVASCLQSLFSSRTSTLFVEPATSSNNPLPGIRITPCCSVRLSCAPYHRIHKCTPSTIHARIATATTNCSAQSVTNELWYAVNGSLSERHTIRWCGLSVGLGSPSLFDCAANLTRTLLSSSGFETYEAYRSGAVRWKCSSWGPRFEHKSWVSVLGDNSAGDQCAADGENMAAGGVSATTVQRQCVRVGAADVVVLRRSVVARSAVDVGKNILKLCCRLGFCWREMVPCWL